MLISSAAFSWNSTGIESEQTYPARVPKIYYLFALSYKYRSGWGLIPQWTRLLWHSTYYTGVFTCVARLDLFSRLCGRLQTVIHRRRPHTLQDDMLFCYLLCWRSWYMNICCVSHSFANDGQIQTCISCSTETSSRLWQMYTSPLFNQKICALLCYYSSFITMFSALSHDVVLIHCQ